MATRRLARLTATTWLLAAAVMPTSGSSAGHQASVQEAIPPLTDPALMLPKDDEFPTDDAPLLWARDLGLREKVTARRLAAAPDHPDTVSLLMATGRYDPALTVLRRIVERHPDWMAAAFSAMRWNVREMLADPSGNYRVALAKIVADARLRAAALPRAETARVARALLSLDTTGDWQSRLDAFAREYADTEPGLLAQVELLGLSPGPAMIAALDEFIRAHPGTNAAASALSAEGFHLGHNAFSFGERGGSDPTDRFFRVYDIYRRLRSEPYRASESAEKADELIVGFSSYQPRYAPGNPERILAALEELLPSLLDREQRPSTGTPVGYVITTKMRELFIAAGQGDAGVEGLFDRLERSAKNRDAIRVLRAESYLRSSDRLIDEPIHGQLRLKALAMLESVLQRGDGFFRRRALATAATARFVDGDYARARALYVRYLDEHPTSDYAWAAALRIGVCDRALNDATSAMQSFERAATRFADNPLARTLARSFAAQTADANGDFTRARQQYEAALAGWDLDYGETYRFGPLRVQPEAASPHAMDVDVTRTALATRVAQLRRTTAVTGGDLVERGRWLIDRRRRDEGLAALTSFLDRYPSSALAADAQFLAHRARLEQALDLADADHQQDVAGALAALTTLSTQSPDFEVCAATMSLATLRFVSQSDRDADATMTEAIRMWRTLDASQPSAAPVGALERDVVAIRNVVFRPKGDGVFQGTRWNAFEWDQATAPYLVVDPKLRVTLSDGEVRTVAAWDPFPGLPNVLFLDPERRELIERVMLKLGGTKHFAVTEVMQTPNQPAGASLNVRELWSRSFHTVPGHWGGWVFETYPIITQIRFLDAARTRAAVAVTVGYSGATVVMEKVNGAWTARELTNRWIT